ncbi:hypothetical protein PENSPDRAFT_688450 [Peniophora sp. CONT]|nr:hypothetical protein PENSPDRAFT_688450 [Peniophora sp. CONT]
MHTVTSDASTSAYTGYDAEVRMITVGAENEVGARMNFIEGEQEFFENPAIGPRVDKRSQPASFDDDYQHPTDADGAGVESYAEGMIQPRYIYLKLSMLVNLARTPSSEGPGQAEIGWTWRGKSWATSQGA